jgi:hypothetical protein
MHDPLVVAFEIRRPWPRRDRAYDKKPGRVSLHSWRGPFWVIGGKGFYWPTMAGGGGRPRLRRGVSALRQAGRN